MSQFTLEHVEAQFAFQGKIGNYNNVMDGIFKVHVCTEETLYFTRSCNKLRRGKRIFLVYFTLQSTMCDRAWESPTRLQ